jgi:hypothetical protein
VGTAMGYGVDGRVSIPGWTRDFSLLHNVHIGSEAHPASYSMDAGGCFPGGKVAAP